MKIDNKKWKNDDSNKDDNKNRAFYPHKDCSELLQVTERMTSRMKRPTVH